MAGFLYFVPGTGQTKDSLREIGFDHAELAQVPGCGVRGDCPGGATEGYVFTLRPPTHPDGVTPKCGYYPAVQTWVETHGGKMWLGWETDRAPTPEDLQRKTTREGHGVKLHDGAEWLVPVFKSLMGGTTLPTIFGCDSVGLIVRDRVEPEFRRVWELTTRLHRTVRDFDGKRIAADDMIELLCSALAMNYRLSQWECLNLGLIADTNQEAIFAAIVDLPSIAAVEQSISDMEAGE